MMTKSKRPSLAALSNALVQDALLATQDYELLREVVLPLRRQSILWNHYPGIIEGLYRSVRDRVIMATCRLFETGSDYRHATLAALLDQVQANASREDSAARQAFQAKLPEVLMEISQLNRRLSIYRNAWLAHRDLTKVGRHDLTFDVIAKALARAREIVAGYLAAYEDTGLVGPPHLDYEAERFLRWCRLNDYAKHFKQAMSRRPRSTVPEEDPR